MTGTDASTIEPLSLLIRKLESTAWLSEEDRSVLEGVPYTVRTFTERTTIVHEGDAPKHCCLILDGWAYRSRSLDQGQRQILAFFVPGDMPDLDSLYFQVTDQGLTAMTRTTVAFISHKDMRALIQRHFGVAMALWRDTLIDAVRARELVTSLGRRQAVGRMAHLFCELYVRLQAVARARDLRYALPVTQTDLADSLGISSVHANRSLQDLRKRGLVTFHGRELIIHDWNGLATIAEFDLAYLHIARRVDE